MSSAHGGYGAVFMPLYGQLAVVEVIGNMYSFFLTLVAYNFVMVLNNMIVHHFA